MTVSDDDVFLISIWLGKVYQGNTYGVLYPSLESTGQPEIEYNLIERGNHQYQRFTIFESHVPPFQYNLVEFIIDSRSLKLEGIAEITVITPDSFYIRLPVNFEVRSNGLTEVNVQVSPFKYITRYRDTYLFQPEMEVVGVNYY
jgi:hypothetical protein